MTDEPWKGGYDKASWLGRFSQYFMDAGAPQIDAESEAAIAWDCSPDDADPEEAASAELAYLWEDSR